MNRPDERTRHASTVTDFDFGPDSSNRSAHRSEPGLAGAVAALETFYCALNSGDLDLLTSVWADDDLVQIDNPVGGILRGRVAVTDLYRRLFTGTTGVQVRFTDAVTYSGVDHAVFAGREIGSYTERGGGRVPLEIRTSRVFQRSLRGRWVQVHHHGSIDDPDALARYRDAVLRPA